MGVSWRDWRRSDIIYGIIVPVMVVLVIVGLSKVSSLIGYGFSGSAGIVLGIIMELEELTVIVAVPLMLGLVWNRWAGGASGFLMGSIYALYWANIFHGIVGSGTVLIAYILSAMLIGYMAGALNKRSEDFRRMLISGIVATAVGGLMLFGIFQLSPANVVTGLNGFLLSVLTRIACGAVIPVVAKVFFWFGMGANKKTKE
jgi:hypothetical protein